MDLAEAETGAMRLTRERVDLVGVVRAAMELYADRSVAQDIAGQDAEKLACGALTAETRLDGPADSATPTPEGINETPPAQP